MTIRFHLGWEDYFSAKEFFREQHYSMPPERILGGLSMLAGALWFLLGNLSLLAVIPLSLGLIVFFGSPHFRRLAARRKWDKEEFYRAEHIVSFSDEGVHYLLGSIESNLDWKYYQRFLESPDGFLLIYGEDSFNLIPMRAFEDRKMIDAFRSLAIAKLGSETENNRQLTTLL